jgi:protein-S-isoprenylcysteine O-methyltransferase Ste14
MALVHSFEKSGNVLFRYRGQIPVILFIAAIPVVRYSGFGFVSSEKAYWISLITCILVSVLGFIVRAYTIGTTPRGTSGRNTKEQVAEVLNSTGIYSVVRHPLYLGNYLMWIGIVGFTFNVWFVICVSLAYWLYYERIMFAEERFLERKFGQDYIDWSNGRPAFFPNFKLWKATNISFSIKAVLRREYSGILATVLAYCFIEILRHYFIMDEFYISTTTYIVLATTFLYTIVMRTLKKSTTILNEEGRS